MLVAVCLKWVDLRPEVDPLTGEVADDQRSFGASAADQAALETALVVAAAWGAEVLAVTAGPAAADAVLRDALAAGAAQAVRVDTRSDLPSAQVAESLAAVVAGADLVCCGDWSLDRGSGSVPAFLAAELGAAQALGLVAVTPGDATLATERRLDRGRRERLTVPLPAVISVEGGSVRLRRAPLAAVLAAGSASIDVVTPPSLPIEHRVRTERTGPYRPRARTRPSPPGDASPRERILALTGALDATEPARTVTADPEAAAELILEQLRSWGYL